MKKCVSVIFALHLVSMNLFAWTNGELLVWMDSDRGYALAPAAKKCETEFGMKVTIERPEKITDSFSIAAQAGKGPLSPDGQPFASTTATASVSAGNAARLLWCQKSARTMTLKEFSITRRARHCNYVWIHFHSVTHS